ncbi:MAG: hypothetical protein ACR652_12615 [Methylocystis sp.]|uniref:hypothetical protein n=1 Tax=Methylocystis sp. TaxID=1911079 RepID=UPI003DA371AE
MTIAAAPSGLQPDEFDRIEAALTETARGRQFLAECARRTLCAERARILADIERLSGSRVPARPSIAEEAAAVAARLLDLSWALRERGRGAEGLCERIEGLARALEWAPVDPAEAGVSPDEEPLPPDDPRLAALSWLDDLPLADRLAIFA